MFFFFFSSRRRHTRSKRDWSSDVCSSDLRMVQGKVEHPVSSAGAAVDSTDRLAGEKLAHREAAERHDDLRLDRRDLTLQKMIARGDLVRLGIAIVGWPTLHDVGDKNIRPLQADRG